MTTEIQRHEPGALAGKLNREQVDVLKSTICKGATDAEMALFLEVCKAKRLDPFSGQIHALKRREKNDAGGWDERLTWQVGIDGFRALAERTGERDGMDPPEWCGDDGVWQPVWLKKEPPRACRVRVYRKGVSRPYETVALWDFYVQTTRDGSPNRMWQRGGPAMLAKCAEALALRMAFPLDLGDLYAPEEIGQAANEPPTFVAPPSVGMTSVGSIIDVPAALGPAVSVEFAASLADRISAASSVAALESLVPDLAAMPDGNAKADMRARYATRKRELLQADAREESRA